MKEKNGEEEYDIEKCIHFLRMAEKIMSSYNTTTKEYRKSPRYLIDGLRIAEKTLKCFDLPWLQMVPYLHAVGMLYFSQIKGKQKHKKEILQFFLELTHFATFLESTQRERREIVKFAARKLTELEESLKNAPAAPLE